MDGEAERTRARESVSELVQRAFTRAEVEEARAALRAHLATYPEDEAFDLAHGLRVSASCLSDREEQSRRLQLSQAEHQEREQMLKNTQVVVDGAEESDVVARIDQAQEHVRRWLERYPGDLAAVSRLAGLKASKALAKEMWEVLREMEPPQEERRPCGR